MKKILSIVLIIFFVQCVTNAQTDNDDRARIYKAMDKGRSGQDLTIGVLGGSITQGHAASTTAKRWANLMADWWEIKFPSSNVELINAGWGGTGSDIGVHRAYDDLLARNPDFVVVEFSVNDSEGDLAKKMMEGLVQQILSAENNPGLMILMLKQDDGTTAQASHKPVAEHYKVPYVNFADLIDAKVAEDGVSLSSIFVDGLHPNDAGMAYIAELISDHLDTIYSTLPDAGNLPTINTTIPTPIVGNTYSNTFQFFYDNIIPINNQGWNVDSKGWNAEVSGNQIDFKVVGNAISLVYTQNIASNRGKAEVWVDDGSKSTIDAFMNEDWGTRYAFALVQEGLSDGEHTLHVRVISESSTSGNFVHIARVLTAGNGVSAAPIAKTTSKEKAVVGRDLILSGVESFDPDGDVIDGFLWTIEEKPAGSNASLSNPTESVATFNADIAGEYTLNLVVTSGSASSVPAVTKVNVRSTNQIPVAVPGNDTISALNKYFRLDGNKSYDDDGDALTYEWVMESAPDGSKTIIMLADSPKPQCKFDVEGNYVISLVVYDSLDYSIKQTITVEGRDGYTNVGDSKSDFIELKVYPNPANNIVNIQYFLTEDEPVIIDILTINGIKIGQIIDNSTVQGLNYHQVSFKDITTAPGVYFVKVSSGTKSQLTKITLM